MYWGVSINYQDVLLLVFRFYLGIIFLSSALGKLRNYNEFIKGVDAYDIIPSKYVFLFSSAVLLIECLAGVFIFIDPLAKIGLLANILLLFMFTSAVSIAVIRKSKIKCNCFGVMGNDHEVGWDTVARNTYLIVIAVIAITMIWLSSNSHATFDLASNAYNLIAFIFVLLIVFLVGRFVELYARITFSSYASPK